MKKSFVILSLMCGLQVLMAADPASAYIYRYNRGKSAVETDMSVLADADKNQGHQDMSGYSDETTPSVPVDSVERLASERRLSHPFFTNVSLSAAGDSPLPALEVAPVHAPAAPKAPVVPKAKAPKPAKAAAVEAASEKPAAKSVAEDQVSSLTSEEMAPEVAPVAPKAEEAAPATVEAKPETAKVEAAPADVAKAEAPKAETLPEITKEEQIAAAQPTEPLHPAAGVKTEETPAAPSAPEEKPVPSMADLSLDFDSTTSNLSPEAQNKLNALVSQIKEGDMRLQIRAYAKGDDTGESSARRLALARGLAVRSYLTEKGVQPVRLDVRALGSETDRTPIDRVDLVFVK